MYPVLLSGYSRKYCPNNPEYAVEAINRFLASLSQVDRMVFMRRYWYVSPIKEIAEAYGMNESKVKSILFRARNKLKLHLEKEGIVI